MKSTNEQIVKDYSKAYNSGILQGQAYKTLQNFLSRALLPYNLSIPEWKLLGQLYDHRELRVADLASLLAYDPPLVTSLIDSLEKKKLLRRKTHKRDRRVKMIIPLQKTLDLIPIIEPEVRKVLASLLIGITPDEMKIYIKILQNIVVQGKELS
ncbi:hypothetical protein BH10BAC1_BH10BAC1_18910 [soil metagenome]